MKIPLMVIAGVGVASALLGLLAAGCDGDSKSSNATSESTTSTTSTHSTVLSPAQAQPTDYARLLIRSEDIDAPETFTASLPIQNSDGRNGVATTFSNEDGSHVIRDKIVILPDSATAARTLDAAKADPPGSITATPVPVEIGTGGTTISGDAPDGSKSLTVLLFTEGRAFVMLEFDGPAGVPAPPDFVTDVGQKQDAAIKERLPA